MTAEDDYCEKNDSYGVMAHLIWMMNTLFYINKVRRCTALAVRNKKL